MQSNAIEKANLIPDSEEQRTIKGLFYLLDQNAYGLDFKVSSGHVIEVQLVAANLTKIPRNLKQLQYLHALHLGNNMISHLRGIENLPMLLKLDLSNNKLEDISDLSNQKKLRRLNLSGNQIRDISILGTLEKLEHLNLAYNKIESMDSIKELKELDYLNVKSNSISIDSLLNIFNNLKKLTTLDAANIGMFNLPENLEINTSIQYLYLSGNQIQDISFLNSFPNLIYADLSNNPISKLNPLDNCPSLKELDLRGTKLPDHEINAAKLGFAGLKGLKSKK